MNWDQGKLLSQYTGSIIFILLQHFLNEDIWVTNKNVDFNWSSSTVEAAQKK